MRCRIHGEKHLPYLSLQEGSWQGAQVGFFPWAAEHRPVIIPYGCLSRRTFWTACLRASAQVGGLRAFSSCNNHSKTDSTSPFFSTSQLQEGHHVMPSQAGLNRRVKHGEILSPFGAITPQLFCALFSSPVKFKANAFLRALSLVAVAFCGICSDTELVQLHMRI